MRHVLVLSALLIGCGSAGPYEPAPVIRPADGGDLCAPACQHMAQTFSADAGPDASPCEESTDLLLKDGGKISCTDLCVYEHQNGSAWNTACLLEVKTCEEISTVCKM